MQVNFPKKTVQPQLGVDSIPSPSPVGLPTLPLSNNYQDLDPIRFQQSLADSLLEQGSSMAPARGGILEGLARAAQGGLGGILKNKADTRLESAKAHNTDALRGDVSEGNWGSMLTSNDPVAQKIGGAILEQTMKRKTGNYKTLDDGTVVWEDLQGDKPEVISRPTTGLPRGYKWDENGNQVFIPGGPADPAVIAKNATGRRKPDPADQTGIPPWERKW